MEINRELIKSDKKIQYDEHVKSFLANKRTLARILAETIDDFKGKTIEEIVSCIEGEPTIGAVPIDPGMTNNSVKIRGANTENSEIDEGLIRFDILFYALTPDGRSQIIVNVEAQKDKPEQYSLLNRAIFYESRLISSQKDRDFVESNYDDIKKTYSIWLCMNQKESALKHFHLVEENLRGNMSVKGKADLFNVIIVGIPSELKTSDVGTLFGYLGVALSRTMNVNERINILRNEYNEKMAEGQEGDVNIMCNLSEGVFEEGVKLGEKQGFEKGEKQGLEQGIAQKGVETAKNMVSMTDLSDEKIAQIVGLSVEEIGKIREQFGM